MENWPWKCKTVFDYLYFSMEYAHDGLWLIMFTMAYHIEGVVKLNTDGSGRVSDGSVSARGVIRASDRMLLICRSSHSVIVAL
ncbi:hypothetical protein M0R45_014282 [Rubus argutus]|uniref:Uncharacterized protein n=1 Tax=Rubus argutus TaxID=59490 RepID=A0AAW1XNH8_RUBAR